MTVCVGAICTSESGQPSGTIVTASDRYLSWGAYSGSQPALKAARLAPLWLTMIAGDDITLGAEDVIRNTRQTLAAYDDGVVGVPEVQAAALASWRDVKNRIAETNVLSAFNLTINKFVEIGRDKFGDQKFAELVQRIEVESLLKCQMLICGFDHNLIPALLVCDDEHPCSDYTRADFMAIGSGHTAAIASLAFHNYTRERTVAEAVYQVCAAKFMAERSGAAGVGRDTLVRLCQIIGNVLDLTSDHN